MALSQSSVHYRFGNNGEFKTLLFDGIHISVDELKKSVAAQEGINLDYVDFTLTNANTQRVYDGPSIVPRNSCVAVVRVPRENPVKIPKISNTDSSGIIQIGFSNVPKTSHINQETFTKMTEQERLLHAIAQSTEKYDPSNYKKRVTMPMNAKASPDHVCNKCNKLGHFPKQCPMLNFRLSTGIPSEELMETTQDDPHAMYHPSGRYVIPIMHYKARETRKLVDKVNYERQKLLSATASSLPGTADAEKPSTPDELKCPLCHDILNEAMLAPCCGESFCATCIHDFMLKGSLTEEGSRCPTCTPPKTISADSLIPNKRVRESVSRWQSVFKISPPSSVNIPSLPRIPSPIPLSAVVLEQKAATLNNNQVQDAPPVNKVPTVNLSAMLAKKEPLQASVPVFMQPLIPPMIPVSTVSVVPIFQQHFENKMTGKVNFSEKAPLQPGIEAIPSTTSASTTSTTAAPPGLTESSFDVEHIYKCPQVIDPQIQADEDAMSRAWDNVFNPDVTLDIFDLNKQQTIDNDKGKEAPKKHSDNKTDRRHYREHDSTRRKDRSRSRNRYGHRDRRYEDDRPRRGRSNRRYDDQRHYERDRRHYKEERHTSSRKQTRHEATPVEPDVVKVVEEVQEKEVVTETVPVETSNEIERPKSCESMALNIVIETAVDDSTPKPVISSSSVQVIQKSVSREPSAEKESKRSSSKKKKKKNKRKKHRSDDESVSEVSSEKKKKKKKKRSRHESDDDSEFEKEKRKKKKKKHHKKDRDSKKSLSSYEKDRRDSVRKSESATRSSRKHRRCDSDDDYHETTRKRRSSPGRQRDSRDYRR